MHPELTEKIEHILNRPAEELYDLKDDPGCWKNVATDPAYESIIVKYRNRLLYEMESTADPELPVFPYS